MVGPRDTGDDSSNGRGTSRIDSDDVKLWIIRALLAVIAGGGGAVGYMNLNPPMRDQITVSQLHEMERRISAMEANQLLDNEHRKDSTEGYKRIRTCEGCCERIQEKINGLSDKVNGLTWRIGPK